MEWQTIVALVVAVPIILFPAAFIWYLNIGGIVAAVKEARVKKATREKPDLNAVRLQLLTPLFGFVASAVEHSDAPIEWLQFVDSLPELARFNVNGRRDAIAPVGRGVADVDRKRFALRQPRGELVRPNLGS